MNFFNLDDRQLSCAHFRTEDEQRQTVRSDFTRTDSDELRAEYDTAWLNRRWRKVHSRHRRQR